MDMVYTSLLTDLDIYLSHYIDGSHYSWCSCTAGQEPFNNIIFLKDKLLLGALCSLTPFVRKENNFHNLSIAILYDIVLSKSKEFAPRGEIFFLKELPILEWRENQKH